MADDEQFSANALADYIRRLFHVESGGNPNAVTGSNRGLGQFGPTEERQFGITSANRTDPNAQANAVVQEYAANNARLARVLGREPTFADHYFTHQQGVAGGPALLTADPQTPAWRVIRPFYGSDRIAQKAITGNIPSDSPLRQLPVDQISAGGFRGLWQDRFNRGMTRAGLSGEAPPVPAEAGPVSPGLQNAMQPQGSAPAPQPGLAPPTGGVQSELAGLGSPSSGGGTLAGIGKSLMTEAGKTKGLPFPDAKLKPFDENLRPLPLNLPNFAALAQIPKFAEGGIVDRPTMAMVGENGPEAIVPLRPMGMAQPDVIGNRIGAIPAVHNFMSDLLTVLKNRAVSAATAPLDAFTGRMQVSDPTTGMPTSEAMERGQGVAGTAMTGAFPFAERGAAGIFGGRLARGAQMGNMEAAKLLSEQGVHPDEIWSTTGWFQGADKQWRHEIPDTLAQFNPKAPSSGKLPQLLTEHPLLYSAYPELKDANFRIVPGEGAVYNGVNADREHLFEFGAKELQQDPSAVLHEVQHAIQAKEGFARGGGVEMRRPFASPFDKELASLMKEYMGLQNKYMDPKRTVTQADIDRIAYIDKVRQTNGRLQRAYTDEAFKNYKGIAGEAEARNVQNRFRVGVGQHPQMTEDIPRSEQLVFSGPMAAGPKSVRTGAGTVPLEEVQRGFDPFNRPPPDFRGAFDRLFAATRGGSSGLINPRIERIDFKSAGAQRDPGKAPAERQPAIETPEAMAKRKAEMKAAFDELMKKGKPEKAKAAPSAPGRIGFKSLGTER